MNQIENAVAPAWLAEDANLADPLAVKYRVPLVTSLYPRGEYIAALVQPREPLAKPNPWSWLNFLPVTEEDIALVAHFIADYRDFFYRASYLTVLDRQPVDLDGAVNTTIFGRLEQGWVYRKRTWENQPCSPSILDEVQFPTLLSLMDRIHRIGTDLSSKHWIEYKAKHGLPA